jgi:hypothetical protein
MARNSLGLSRPFANLGYPNSNSEVNEKVRKIVVRHAKPGGEDRHWLDAGGTYKRSTPKGALLSLR